MNMTAKLKDTIVIPCVVTGTPEPVVEWFKEPSTQITLSQSGQAVARTHRRTFAEHNILGTSLAIRDINVDDEGTYRCVAASAGEVAYGHRRVTIESRAPL
jgi:hypothetical protein